MSTSHRGAWLGACLLASAACSDLPAGAKGAACERSAQCAAGLACVEHECSNDLDSIAEQNTVPDLGAGEEGGVVVGSDAAVSTPDAGAADDGGGSSGSTDSAVAADTGMAPVETQDASSSDEDGG